MPYAGGSADDLLLNMPLWWTLSPRNLSIVGESKDLAGPFAGGSTDKPLPTTPLWWTLGSRGGDSCGGSSDVCSSGADAGCSDSRLDSGSSVAPSTRKGGEPASDGCSTVSSRGEC